MRENKKVSRRTIAENVTKRLKANPYEVQEVVDSLFDIVIKQVISGLTVNLTGVGKLSLIYGGDVTTFCNKTSRVIVYPKRKNVKFRTSVKLKNHLSYVIGNDDE